MPATWRDFREVDLLPCLNVDQRRIGDGIIGRNRAIAMWRRLVCCESFKAQVFEFNPPPSGYRIIGFGAGVFVEHEFVAAELRNPEAGLNDRLIARMESESSSVVLSAAKLRTLNTRGMVDMIVLYANWMDSLVKSRQKSDIQRAFALSMFEVFSGYRLGTILCEEIGGAIRNFREATHVWRVVQQFDGQDRGLICLTREDGLSVAGSVYGGLFCYREPTLKLRNADKQLLIAARSGATDRELASSLNISLAAVKKRWRSVFERIGLKRPDLLPLKTGDRLSEMRGLQKRHVILAYIR